MDKRLRTSSGLAGAILTAVALTGCGDSTGVGVGQEVSLNFRVGGGGVPATVSGPAAAPSRVVGPPMVLTGTNGTLTLDEIRIIINEVELHRADGFCASDDSSSDSSDDSSSGSDDDCGEFEAAPRFLDLPLDGEPIEAVTALIQAGAYKELDFEIEDLEDDEEDPAMAALIAAVRAEILDEIPDWPRKASAMVSGTFEPTSGDPVDFRVFLEAEIEIEFELIPNLVVDEAGGTSRDLTVDVRPDIWFGNPDGTVVELQAYDYDATGQLLEFEVEMEDGFTEIEFDD